MESRVVSEGLYALPQLAKLTEREYREALGHLNTGIPYLIFHRNVMMAMERLQQR